MDLSFYKSPLAQEIREQGREEGRQEGRVEGQTQRAAEDVLEVLEVRGLDIPEAVRQRILGCDDPETLRRWHRRAVITPSAEEIFTDDQDDQGRQDDQDGQPAGD